MARLAGIDSESTELFPKETPTYQSKIISQIPYQNWKLLLQFQQYTRSKAADIIANTFMIMWTDEFLFFTIPFTVWFLRGTPGITLLFIIDVDGIINGYLKWMIQKPRPFWCIPGLKNIDESWRKDYSFPSSHAQGTSSFATAVTILLHSIIPWYILLIICMLPICSSISRIYLGVHGMECIITGFFVGVLLSTFCCLIFPLLMEFISSLPVFFSLLFLCVVVCIFYSIFYIILKLFPLPNSAKIDEWKSIAILNTYNINYPENALNDEAQEKQIIPRKYSSYTVHIWTLIGGGVGIMLTDAFGDSTFYEKECVVTKHNVWIMFKSVFIGYVGIIILFPLIFIFPAIIKKKHYPILAFIVAIVFAFISGIWLTFIAPLAIYKVFGSC